MQKNRLSMFSWALFDWASTPFFTVILTFVFSTYFVSKIAPTDKAGSEILGYIEAVAGVLTAILAVSLGTIADRVGGHKRWVGAFTLLTVMVCVPLYWAYPEHSNMFWVAACIGMGLVAGEVMMVFYNAFLLNTFPESVRAGLSGLGWGLSFFGGLFCLFVVLLVYKILPDAANDFVPRLSGIIVSVWLIVFSLPFFFFVKETKAIVTIPGASRHTVNWKKLYHDLKARPMVWRYLLARMLYMDGINTMLAFAGVYAVSIFHIPLETVLFFGVSINAIAGVGSLATGWIETQLGPKKTIFCFGLLLIVSTAWMLSTHEFYLFWILAAFFGVSLGPIQSSSRTMLCLLVPKELATEMFGFYALSGRVTAFLGPLLFASLTAAYGSQRIGMAASALLVLIGCVLLFFVKPAPEK